MTTQEFNSQEFNDICSEQRKHIRSLSLDEQYTQHIEYRGIVYRYDPDYDCFYPLTRWEDQTHWDRWSWIYALLVLAVLAYWASP